MGRNGSESLQWIPALRAFRAGESDHSQSARRSLIFRGALLFAGLVLFLPPSVSASKLSCFRTMDEYALGPAVYLPERFVTCEREDAPRSIHVDIATLQLFGIPGLKADAAGIRLDGTTYGCAAHALVLSSPVGNEKLFDVEVSALFGRRLQSALALQYRWMHLNRFESAFVVTAALKMCARVREFMTAGCTIDNYGLAGDKTPRTDASAFVYAHPVSGAGIYVCCALDGVGYRSMSAGVIIHACTAVRIIMGYDDGTHMLRGALTIRAGRLRLSVGSGIHPVLGTTRGISMGGEI